uniref:Small ribosomal subunit protein uS10m n=1 Tax=Nothoprocta perdicaria TaxID=30464 RepID=A0A8C6ZBB6_NOTPE
MAAAARLWRPLWQVSAAAAARACPRASCRVSISDEPETLYKRLSLLVKGHDRAVLDSYEFFAVLAAKELGISVEKVHRPPKTIERFTLLKSVHIFKKHRVQYEMRTHYLCLELKHVTGSTAAVYLEYVQRNLPEGVAMEVKKVITTVKGIKDDSKHLLLLELKRTCGFVFSPITQLPNITYSRN